MLIWLSGLAIGYGNTAATADSTAWPRERQNQPRGVPNASDELARIGLFVHHPIRTRALRAGFLVHVSKPVDPSELIATVASVAGRVADDPER